MNEHIKLYQMIVGNIGANCYIIGNEETKEAICFDPGDEGNRILDAIEREGFLLAGVFLTHGHSDHIMGTIEIRKKFPNVPVYADAEEQEVLMDRKLNMTTMIGSTYEMEADVLLSDMQEVSIIGLTIQCLHTPGHTKGGMCFYLPEQKMVIAGDTLFEGSIGRTDFPTGDYETLAASIRNRLYTLPEETIVYPGHGDATSIEREKSSNMFVRG